MQRMWMKISMHVILQWERRTFINGRIAKCIAHLNAIIRFILGSGGRMLKGCKKRHVHLIGTHDFTSFCSSKTATSNNVRTVRLLTVEKRGDELIMTIEGDGFLYNMVRTIAGMLFAVGIGWYDPQI